MIRGEDFPDVLLRAADRLDVMDYSEPLLEGARAIGEGVSMNFLREADSAGRGWLPRKDSLPHPLLRKTMRMYHSITNPDDPNAIKRGDRDSLEFGTDGGKVPYASIQNDGGKRIPPREYAYIHRDDEAMITNRFGAAVSPKFYSLFKVNQPVAV